MFNMDVFTASNGNGICRGFSNHLTACKCRAWLVSLIRSVLSRSMIGGWSQRQKSQNRSRGNLWLLRCSTLSVWCRSKKVAQVVNCHGVLASVFCPSYLRGVMSPLTIFEPRLMCLLAFDMLVKKVASLVMHTSFLMEPSVLCYVGVLVESAAELLSRLHADVHDSLL